MASKPGFSITPIEEGVSLIEENHVASWLRCNIWHIKGKDRDLLIDSGMGLRSAITTSPPFLRTLISIIWVVPMNLTVI